MTSIANNDAPLAPRWLLPLVLGLHGAALAAAFGGGVSTARPSPQTLEVSLFTAPSPAPAAVAPIPVPQTARPTVTRPFVRLATPASTSRETAPPPAAAPNTPSAPTAVGAPAATPAHVAAAENAPLAAPRFDADYLRNPAPMYPPQSRRFGEEGKVVLRVFVEPDGRPSQVDVKTGSGFERLDLAAQEAVRRWQFVAARRGDAAVGAWVLVPIVFNLRG